MSGTPRATTASERLVNAIWNKTSTVGELHESARALVNEAHTLERELTAVTRERGEARAEIERLREDAERYATVRAAAYVAINPHHKTSLWTLRGIYEIDGKDFDAAIDAARKEA